MDFSWLALAETPSLSLSLPLPRHSTALRTRVHRRHPNTRIRDRIAEQIRDKLNLSKEQLSLAQVLESATWKGGREIAKEKRPESGGPPIEIVSDGTVF